MLDMPRRPPPLHPPPPPCVLPLSPGPGSPACRSKIDVSWITAGGEESDVPRGIYSRPTNLQGICFLSWLCRLILRVTLLLLLLGLYTAAGGRVLEGFFLRMLTCKNYNSSISRVWLLHRLEPVLFLVLCR